MVDTAELVETHHLQSIIYILLARVFHLCVEVFKTIPVEQLLGHTSVDGTGSARSGNQTRNDATALTLEK